MMIKNRFFIAKPVECSTEQRLIKAHVDMVQLLAHKYGVEEPAHTDELEDVDQNDLTRIDYKINKMDKDR
jgi:hypothetical protein